jgi:hypothetical protein
MKKAFLVLLIAVFALSMGTGTALAAWSTAAGFQTVLTTAAAGKLSPVATTANPVYTTVAGEVFAANDLITITLTGGAKFSGAAVTMTPSAGPLDLGNGAGGAAAPISGGTAGSTTATWRVAAGGNAVGVTLTLNLLTVASIDVTGVTTGSNVDLQMTAVTVGGVPIGTTRSHFTDKAAYLFTGAASEVVAFTATTDTADVSATTGAFTLFTTGLKTGTAPTTTITNSSGAATLPTNLAMALNTILLTLTGDFTGITSVRCTGCTGSSSAGAVDATYPNLFKLGTGVAYAVNTGALAAGAALTTSPLFTLNGTTQQSARSFTMKVQNLGETGNWTAHVIKDTATIYTISKNGKTHYAYNIPNSSNVDGAFVRIINTSSQAGNFYGTMYNESGALIGTASTLLGNVAAQSTLVLNATQLQTSFGTWTGRARLQVDAEVPTMEVYCLIRAANGTLTNLSPVAP